MSESINYLLFVIIAILSHTWVIRRFWGSFLVRRPVSPLSVFSWILLCSSQFAVQYFRQGTSLWITLFNTLFILFVVLSNYEPTGWETCFLFAFFCLMWGVIELALASLFTLMAPDYHSLKLVGGVSSLILMMTFSYIMSLLSDKKRSAPIPKRLAFALLLVPVGSFYIMFVQNENSDSYVLSIGVFVILLLFNMAAFDAYIKFSRYFLRERENAVYAEQLSMVSRNMEEQKKLMEEFYEEKHNLINELTALRGNMESENSGAALRELDKILDGYHGIGGISSSGNGTVDAIINAKYAAARKYGISFHLHICIPDKLTVSPRDLGVVIGNALDNAVAAVKECSAAEKSVHISMGIKKNALVMVMKNPYRHTLRRNRSGELLSTKSEKEKHGYGIRSIRRIADAYGGDAVIDANHGFFTLTVVLNLGTF